MIKQDSQKSELLSQLLPLCQTDEQRHLLLDLLEEWKPKITNKGMEARQNTAAPYDLLSHPRANYGDAIQTTATFFGGEPK